VTPKDEWSKKALGLVYQKTRSIPGPPSFYLQEVKTWPNWKQTKYERIQLKYWKAGYDHESSKWNAYCDIRRIEVEDQTIQVFEIKSPPKRSKMDPEPKKVEKKKEPTWPRLPKKKRGFKKDEKQVELL